MRSLRLPSSLPSHLVEKLLRQNPRTRDKQAVAAYESNRAAQPYSDKIKKYTIGRPDAGAPLDAIGGVTLRLSAFSRWASVPPLLGLMSITPSSREGHAGSHWPMSNPGTSQQCSRHLTLQQQECAQGSNLQSLAPVFLEGGNNSSIAFMWLHPGLSEQALSVLCNGGAAVTLQICRQCHGRSNLSSASP